MQHFQVGAVLVVLTLGCSDVGTTGPDGADSVAAQSAFGASPGGGPGSSCRFVGAAGTGSPAWHTEFEKLPVQETSAGDAATIVASTAFSGGKALMLLDNAAGDFMTVAMPVPSGDPTGTPARLALRARTGPSAGIAQASMATGVWNPSMPFQNLGSSIDFYAPLPSIGCFDLGTIPFQLQPAFLKFTVIGKNPGSGNYYVTADSLDQINQ